MASEPGPRETILFLHEHEQNRPAFGAGIEPIYKNYLEFSRQGPKDSDNRTRGSLGERYFDCVSFAHVLALLGLAVKTRAFLVINVSRGVDPHYEDAKRLRKS